MTGLFLYLLEMEGPRNTLGDSSGAPVNRGETLSENLSVDAIVGGAEAPGNFGIQPKAVVERAAERERRLALRSVRRCFSSEN